MRTAGIVCLGILTLATAGAVGQEAATPAPDSKAHVYVYRYKQYMGKGIRPSVYCDEKEVARIQSGRSVVMALAPGKHSFRSNDKQSQVEVDLKPGQNYYIRVEIATGFWKGHGRLIFVMPEQGVGEFKQMKPVDKGMIKDAEFLVEAPIK
jgi:Protein of unknown function (DUF2846)